MSVLSRVIPAQLKKPLKRLKSEIIDLWDIDERRRDMIPPRHLNFVGDGNFRAVGVEFKWLFRVYGGLEPDDQVLDVGSGIGRMAGPLTEYLSEKGGYEGFDIVKTGIEWCQRNISPRFKNFHFRHADIRNKVYNPKGIYEASNYRFPYDNETFDFIYATSVFTHMFPRDVENYFDETSRVLKRGGRSFTTFFLMNQESEDLIRRKASSQNFIHKLNGCFTTTRENPEAAIAFDESYCRSLYEQRGLSIRDGIHYGSWCGRRHFVSYQDIVVATKD